MKYIHVFKNTANSASYVNSDKYIEPSFVYTRSRRTTDYYPKMIRLCDIVYWDGSAVCTVSQSKWNSSLGTPVGVVVIPEGMLPDGKARMISLYSMDTSGNTVTSGHYAMKYGGSGTDTQLTNYTRVSWTNNDGSLTTNSASSGYLPSDKFTGPQSYFDPLAKYYRSRSCIPSPYLGDNSTFNPEYIKDISGYNNALTDFNGLNNTQTLVGLGTNYYAANACWKYKGGVANVQWYLPAAGELGFLMPRYNAINSALSLVGGLSLPDNNYYWSSSEFSSTNAYCLDFTSGKLASYTKSLSIAARPFAIVEA